MDAILESGREKKNGRVSAKIRWRHWQLLAGSRFQPGPGTRYNVDLFSKLPGLPSRSERNTGFLLWPMKNDGSSIWPVALGIGEFLAGLSGPGLALVDPQNRWALFWHPSHTGYATMQLGNERFHGVALIEHLDGHTQGYGSFGYRSQGNFSLKLEGSRSFTNDVNRKTDTYFPNRKGKSGEAWLSMDLPLLGLLAAGEDRGLQQYRILESRLTWMHWLQLDWLLQATAYRWRTYGSDADSRYFRCVGLGAQAGLWHTEPNQLRPQFQARLVITGARKPRPSLGAEASLEFRKGSYSMELGFKQAHRDWAFAHFTSPDRFGPARRIYEAPDQLLSVEAGSANVRLQLYFIRSQDNASSQTYFQIQGRWKLPDPWPRPGIPGSSAE